MNEHGTRNAVDAVAARGFDLGLPALAGAWAGIAIIRSFVVLCIIRLQRAPTQASLAKEGESRDQPPRIPA